MVKNVFLALLLLLSTFSLAIGENSINGVVSGKVSFVDNDGTQISIPDDAWIRILPSSSLNGASWLNINCKVDSTGNFGSKDCFTSGFTSKVIFSLNDPSETFQVVVYKEHKEDKHSWSKYEDQYNYIDSVQYGYWANPGITIFPWEFVNNSGKENPSSSLPIWYQDYDGDTYGNLNQEMSASSQPSGYVPDSGDCNDNDKDIFPGAPEIAGDGIDQDCDGKDKQAVVNTADSISIGLDLSFKFPEAVYKALTGDVNLWMDFVFFKEENGNFLWELESYGNTTITGNPITINPDLSFTVPNAEYTPLIGGTMNLEMNFKFFSDQSGKLLWELENYTIK